MSRLTNSIEKLIVFTGKLIDWEAILWPMLVVHRCVSQYLHSLLPFCVSIFLFVSCPCPLNMSKYILDETKLCALPAPLYKKRMYNQVQIDRAELGEEAGMRGRATYNNPPDVSPTWKPFIRTVVVRVQLRLTLFLVKKIHSGWKSDRNTAEKTDCKVLLSCCFFILPFS